MNFKRILLIKNKNKNGEIKRKNEYKKRIKTIA
jgi:hypothetical protein